MKKPYHILDSAKQQRLRPDELTRLLSQNAQLMLPLVELIEQCRGAVDEVIDVTGRAAIQAVLELSAQQVTGGDLSQPGKKRAGDVLRWGRQSGRVNLSDRKLRVAKPRLRKRSGGEVEVPAYEALQDDERLGSRMLDILMKGVSTRQYSGVISEMADTVGVSKSAVSRDTIEAAEKKIDELFARRFDDVDLLVIYVDGLIFSGHTVLAAVGVDTEGNKHVLGLQHAATENAASRPRKRGFLYSMVRRLYARLYAKSLVTPRCSAVARTSCATSSTGCRRPNRIRPKRQSARPGGSKPRTVKRGSRSWPNGTRATGPRRRRVCARVSRSVSRSIAWDCRRRCIVVWRRPTSSRVRTPACGGGHGA